MENASDVIFQFSSGLQRGAAGAQLGSAGRRAHSLNGR